MRKTRKGSVQLLILIAAFIISIIFIIVTRVVIFRERLNNNNNNNSKREIEMGVKIMDATVSTFDDVFEKFKNEAPKNKANLVLFLADIDPQTSLSWCPDCVRAEPVIYGKVEASSGDVGLLRAYVGDRPTWRNPHHPWRVDSRFKLTGVPTLIRWENDSVKGRLEDHEAHVGNKIDALLA